ncbi:hypothetical protein BX589_14320 [Paraburkholderia fungorum]|jgi:hypothetical protein|uniref:DUF5658 family protein n=1 Tax=Paraburkholderia fungorum TaxID=134537 RepID=UPI000D42467E|nr:DUF5658 family protein [Paraburkholderia fungorum]PRZ44853.1 hypothetical protein BX589_14320 [Paraburkholderia fungorum]
MIQFTPTAQDYGDVMRTDHPSNAIIRNRTPLLLAVVAGLQILDWHSTLTAPPYRHETNRLINELAGWIGFACAVSLVKALFLIILGAGFFFWRRNKHTYELEYGLCLGVLVVVYSCIVINNYAG